MRESIKHAGPHSPVTMRFSQDDLGAFECRHAGTPCWEALDAAARGQSGSYMTVRFQGHSRIGDSSFHSGGPSSGKAPSEGASFLERDPFREGGSIAIFGQFPAGASSQEPKVSPALGPRSGFHDPDQGPEHPRTRRVTETTPASRIRRLRPKARGPAGRGPIDAVPEGLFPTGTVSRRLACPAGGSEKSVWVVAGLVFPEGPHALQDLALRVQASVHLVASPPHRGFVEGLYLIGPLRSSGIAERLVADVFQLPVAGLVELLDCDLVPAGGAFDSHLAVAKQLLLGREPVGGLDHRVEQVGPNRPHSGNLLKLLDLRVRLAKLGHLFEGGLLLLVGAVQQAVETLHLSSNPPVAEF